MKRASYRYGVEWVAFNDEPGEMNPERISGFISVCLLADLFDVTSEKIVADVLRIRRCQQMDDSKSAR